MQIRLRKSDSHWIKYDNAEFFIDYPSRDQAKILIDEFKRISGMMTYELNPKTGKHQVKEDPEIVVNCSIKLLDLKRLLIKYTVRNWKYVADLDDNEIECETFENTKKGECGTELKRELWQDLCLNEDDTEGLYNVISDDVNWTNLDKKKSNSAKN